MEPTLYFLKILTLFIQKSCRAQAQEENSGYQDLKKMVNLAPQFLKLKHCLEQTIQIVIAALRGMYSDGIRS